MLRAFPSVRRSGIAIMMSLVLIALDFGFVSGAQARRQPASDDASLTVGSPSKPSPLSKWPGLN